MGARSIVKVMEVFNEVFENTLGELPCANTIDLWVRKCGLATYNSNASKMAGAPYCTMIDESMMIGSNKLFLTIAAPASHQGRPLAHSDVAVIGIDTKQSYNAQRVCDAVTAACGKVGHAPEYVISDNASIMRKGITLAGYRRHADITHTLGMFLERTYKNDPEFVEYCKQMSNAQFQHNMKQIAYIMPPRQRTIARFINMEPWTRWSLLTNEVFHTLGKEERKALLFVPGHASLVDELSEVMQCVRYVEDECKSNGLSLSTAGKCIKHLQSTIMQGNERVRKLSLAIIGFLRKETEWMKDGEVHNNSSDIIESSFGVYKERKSPNKLYGVTSMVLMLPVYEKLSDEESARNYNFKEHLENVKTYSISLWSKDHLLENLVTKRLNTLSPAVGF